MDKRASLGHNKDTIHKSDGTGDPIPEAEGSLDGLRSLLDDWNTGRGPERERDERTIKARQESTRAHIYSSYLKQAEQEDKVLVERWTETSNILLVFSGLQSAIVVAFIIFAETSTDDLGQINALLQSMLHHMDNSTASPTDAQPRQGIPSVDARASACWYASLACSLLSAFGGLLSKQWVIHYASRPLWANTTTLQCRLRELRHGGLERWKAGWFVDLLVITLQISVLAFATGLILHLNHTSSVHSTIILSFTAFGGAIFVTTLIAGSFIPECPFKSSITGSLNKLVVFVALSLPHVLAFILVQFWMLLNVVLNSRELSNLVRVGRLWLQSNASRIDRIVAVGNIEKEVVENRAAGAAGVLCWWLAQEDSECSEDSVDIKTVVDDLGLFPAMVIHSLLRRAQAFTFWSSKVVDNLRTLTISTPSRNYHLQMSELLCDLMHRSWYTRIFALKAAKSSVLNHAGQFCSILREAWCNGRRSNVLPIALMRWPTVSLYLQLQLQSWSLVQQHGDTLNPGALVRDLFVILEDSRLEEGRDISVAVALVALVLVDGDGRIGSYHRVRQLSNWTPPERLLQALHLLSEYSSNSPPNELIVAAVRLSADEILRYWDDKWLFLITRHCWRTGDIAGTLIRLLRLGHSWRCLDTPSQVELGERLTNEVWRIMSRVAAFLTTRWVVPPVWFVLSSEEGLAALLQSYGQSSTCPSFNLDALRVMDFVLGLRLYHARRAARRILPWTSREMAPTPPGPPPECLLTDYPHIITQLIHDIENSIPLTEERRIVLSVLVKGRHIFFAPTIVSADESLQEVLDLLETRIMGGNPLLPIIEPWLEDFYHWGKILVVLRQLERESLEKGSDVVVDRGLAMLDAAGSVPDG